MEVVRRRCCDMCLRGTVPDPVVMEGLPFKEKVCAGDAMRFTEYGEARRFRLVMDVDGVRIGSYRGR